MTGRVLAQPSTRNELQRNILIRPASSQREVKSFFSQQKKLSTKIPTLRKALGLGSEYKLLVEIVRRSTPTMPWSWVQQSTQRVWAENWGLSERTLKRHLLDLQANGWVTVSVEPVTTSVVRKCDRVGVEFPIYRVNQDALQLVISWDDPTNWGVDIQDLLVPKIRRDIGGNTVDNGTFDEYQLTARECQNGTFTNNVIPLTSVINDETHPYLWDSEEEVGPLDFKVLPISDSANWRKHPVFSNPSRAVDTINKSNNKKNIGNTVSTRRHRRRVSKREVQIIEVVDSNLKHRVSSAGCDEDGPVIGSTRDLFGSEGRESSDSTSSPRKRADTTLLLAHFEQQWETSRQRYPRVARSVPAYVARGNKAPCLKWFKTEVLPGRSLDEAKALVDVYVSKVFRDTSGWRFKPNSSGDLPPVWLHFRSRFTKTVSALGTYSSEQDRKEARSKRKESVGERRSEASKVEAEWDRFKEDQLRLEEREFSRIPVLIDHESDAYWWTWDVGLSESTLGGTYCWGDVTPPNCGRKTYLEWLQDNPDVARDRYDQSIWSRIGIQE